MNKTLYISYDGLTDALGQSQILPYLMGIVNHNHQIDIISFEKSNIYESNKRIVENMIKNVNINWYSISYTKSPPILSTIWDICKALKQLKKLYQKNNYQIIHCRGYITGIIGLKAKKKYNLKLIFDMRGWWCDEKLESGNWDKLIYKPVYNYFKKKEKELFKFSDKTISLTFSGKEEILKNNWTTEDKIGVIPTCVDFKNFPEWHLKTRDNVRLNLSLPLNSKILIYSGSLGGNYNFKNFIFIFKNFLKRSQNNHIIILSNTSKKTIQKNLYNRDIDYKRITIINSPFSEVHKYLQACDIGLVLYDISFSTIGRSPTKLGEYWASGIPILSLKGIGDLNQIILKYPFGGQLIENLEQEQLYKSFNILENTTSKKKLRLAAKDYFHIDKGVEFYSNIYKELLK